MTRQTTARGALAAIPLRTWIYLAVALALVGIYIVQETARPQRNAIPVPSIGETVDRIVAATAEGEIELRRADDQWLIGEPGIPADQSAVAELIGLVDGMERADVVTARAAYADYGLETDTRRLRFFAGDIEPVAFELGDGSAAGAGVYARINGSTEVVLVPSRLAAFATLDQTRFRRTTMVEIPEEEVVAVTVSGSVGAESRLVRVEADEWGLESGDDIDEGTIGGFFQELSALRAVDFPPLDSPTDAAAIAGGAPVARLEVERAQGPRVRLEFFAPVADADRVLVASSETPFPFYVATWRVRRLLLGLEELVAPFE